jgi:hypothetical protein
MELLQVQTEVEEALDLIPSGAWYV